MIAVMSSALIFWIAVIVAVVALPLRWWPVVVISLFVASLFSDSGRHPTDL